MADDSYAGETQLESTVLTGTIAGRFVIRERLGAGGMGEVYRADDTKLNRPVALKRIAPRHKQNPEYRAKFRKEAERASILYDPHIASIHDVIEVEDEILLVMEYIEGQTLRGTLRQPYSLPEFLDVAIQCSQGLIAAHSKGIVHRDIKPENIMLSREGQVKICDFGLARQLLPTEKSTVAGNWPAHLSGTPAYMAPEVLLGAAGDQRVDIFSLGVVFYEMLTGVNPFAGTSPAVRERVTPVSQLNPRVPAKVEQILAKMLAKDPDARCGTLVDVLGALQDVELPAREPSRNAHAALTIAVASIILLVVAVFVFDRLGTKPAPLTERDYLLIGQISNGTGETVFDETLGGALAAQLSQSPFLNIVSDQRIQNALRFMGRPADAALTPQLALELCRRESLKATLTGSMSKIGTKYVFSVRAVNCQTGDLLATEQVEVDRLESILGAVGTVASKLRVTLGESLASIKRFDEPIESATTPSLEAFRAFTLGNAARRHGNIEAALVSFKHAIELDPNFALAYARLSQTYYNREERSAGAEYAKKAFDLRDRVSEREKLYIAITYYHTVTGETEKTLELYELWRQLFPRDVLAYTGQIWISLDMGLNIDRTIELAKAAVAIDASDVPANLWLAMSYVVNNQYTEGRTVVEQGLARGLEAAKAHFLLYWIAFARGETAAANAQLQWIRNRSQENWFILQQGHAAAFSGKLKNARAAYQRGRESAQQFELSESAAIIAAEEAFTEAELGSAERAKRRVSEALKIERARHPLGLSAIALARAGATSDAQLLIDEMAERFPKDFHVKSIWIPIAQSAIALNQGSPQRAVDLLKPTTPYELGTDVFIGTSFRPIFLRGEAYLALKAGPQAVEEFKKIIDHRGVFPVSPLYPLAQLGLARAYALSGDVAQSRASYKQFLTFWQDADPDLSLLEQAKLELNQLDRLNRQQ